MRAKQFWVLTTTESRAKIWRQKSVFKTLHIPIVCLGSVIAFVLLCITLCPL